MTIAEMKSRGLLLLECVSGSRAYGLATPQSDTDIKGVFYLPKEHFYGLGYIEQINNDTNDEVYYELGRFVSLLLKNNPNLLETLAAPDDCILYRHPVMQHLTADLFLSALCRETFGSYAVTQIKKARGLNKKMLNPQEKARKSVTDFCYILEGGGTLPLQQWLEACDKRQECCGLSAVTHARGMYALYYDVTGTKGYRGITTGEDANEVCLSSVPEEEAMLTYLFFNRDGYSIYCKEYREYWDWVDKRNELRFLGNQAHGGDYDAKNMMHTIRLLQMAVEIGATGKLQVRRNNREQLLAIKEGRYTYEALLKMAEALQEEMVQAYSNTVLQAMPDKARIEKIVVDMRTALYG
ncbi:hypothetical protein HNQ91_005397 [Filimonas zeae]|uniref:Nucleotidyltransferase n=1 Tax=Filimonas zeae TaxID=1737353 RepID=A0A917J300_9BACT|nr:nucleotidyltransferase domain-containing protein [Filimonas zeae]MDR6342313.1 hypothetical protein [Filimonas zeae]GGH80832.1 hypothetical protein GCM10011379_52290 [Filimonas zeae]